jgi:ethanolamine utilization microcompartment shell protein EutS
VSAANFHQSVRGARALMALGFIGQPYGDLRSKTGVNQSPQAVDVWTITVPASPDDSVDYAITSGGVTATYAADSSSTQDEVGNGLVAAWNATPVSVITPPV